MKISTKGRYALRVMVELSCHDPEVYVPLEEIAEQQEISKKYLEAIVKRLVQEQLIIGLRGKGGGYKLARSPETYTVGSILKATEGSLAPVACLESCGGSCPRAGECVTLPLWKDLHKLIDDYLEGITLDQLKGQVEL
ncbi:MAG: Rrf2 family transcriptional regulator [Firmicutes bacterium]|nr:Rrf2 family transcriptional regulator [Bacillota bacterium]